MVSRQNRFTLSLFSKVFNALTNYYKVSAHAGVLRQWHGNEVYCIVKYVVNCKFMDVYFFDFYFG